MKPGQQAKYIQDVLGRKVKSMEFLNLLRRERFGEEI
jgi:hypothetical protein